MSDSESIIQAVKLITVALVDRLGAQDRQAVIDDLHAVLVTVRDENLSPKRTVDILHTVIEYLQAGEDVADARYRRRGQ